MNSIRLFYTKEEAQRIINDFSRYKNIYKPKEMKEKKGWSWNEIEIFETNISIIIAP